jgi:hypothetical protein
MLNYLQFIIREAIIVDSKDLLMAVKHKKVNINDIFHLDSTNHERKILITELYNDPHFETEIQHQKLEKSQLESSIDFESFLKDNLNIKFFFLFSQGKMNIEQPRYLLLQKRRDEHQWEPIQSYLILGDIQPFYEALRTKTIELEHRGQTYIYVTTNGGNDWILQNINQTTKTFKKDLTKKQLHKLLNDKDLHIKVDIIQ